MRFDQKLARKDQVAWRLGYCVWSKSTGLKCLCNRGPNYFFKKQFDSGTFGFFGAIIPSTVRCRNADARSSC